MTGDRVRRDGARWGIRVIRPGGVVVWLGRKYKLDDSPADLSVEEFSRLPMDERCSNFRPEEKHCPRYDGSMDGSKGLFYTYGDHHEASKTHVYLHSIPVDPWPGRQCVAGVFVWTDFEVVS